MATLGQRAVGLEGGVNMSSLAVTFDSDLVTLTTESITRVSTAAHAGLPLTDDLGVRIDGRHGQGVASGSRKPPTATPKRRSRQPCPLVGHLHRTPGR